MSSNPNYDSELCGKVPIHLINTVQPYGVLLVLSRASLEFIQVSENVNALFGVAAQCVIKTTIDSHLDAEALDFLKRMATAVSTDKVPQVWTIDGRQHF